MIKKYSYGHLMILEISSDQQKRPAGLIKREIGVNPVRSRHCDSCFSAAYHWKIFSGKVLKVYRLKSGDLLALEKVISYGVLRKALFLYLKYILRRGSFLLQEGM